jgi:hypothetical protein
MKQISHIHIPYYICRAKPSEDIQTNNIINITNCSAEKDNLKDDIIDFIVEDMYEFCSSEYGHNISISSYDDYCNKYWEFIGYQIHHWWYIYSVKYFEDNKWISWNVEENGDDIYIRYVERFQR